MSGDLTRSTCSKGWCRKLQPVFVQVVALLQPELICPDPRHEKHKPLPFISLHLSCMPRLTNFGQVCNLCSPSHKLHIVRLWLLIAEILCARSCGLFCLPASLAAWPYSVDIMLAILSTNLNKSVKLGFKPWSTSSDT